MGNLGDAFKKAGLISEQDAKRQAEEAERARGRGRPPEASDRGGRRDERPAAERPPRRDAPREERRDERRDRGDRSEERRDRGDERRGGRGEGRAPSPKRRAEDLARDGALGRSAFGDLPWHFEADDGELPAVFVSKDTATGLADGSLGLAARRDEVWILPRAKALEITALDPSLIRCLKGHPEATA